MKLETRHNKNTLIGVEASFSSLRVEDQGAFSGSADKASRRAQDDAPDATQFSIKAGPEIMRILSSSLYTDKIGAVVRELIANARDAYAMVDVDKRHDIAFGITIDSEAYTIRDYGIGLSCEDTLRLMTTYGASTKTQDNNSVGCFGVGSKSGFAYTQEFTMTSFFNGEQHTFHAILGTSGVPEMIHLGTILTEEPNGVMFRIPLVDRADSRVFEEKVGKLCKSIGVPSQLIYRGVHTSFTGKEFLAGVGREYAVGKSNEAKVYLLEEGRASIMVGGIRYEYNQFNFPFGMLVELPIGSVDIAVSREALEDTKKNMKYVGGIVDQAVDEITKDIKNRMAEAPSLYDKLKILDTAPYLLRWDIKKELPGTWGFIDLPTTTTGVSSEGELITCSFIQSVSIYDLVNSPSAKYILQSSPKKITKSLARYALGFNNPERILRQYCTREEWMQSPLGPEIRATPTQFIFSSDIVVPKMIKPAKPKLQQEQIRVGRVCGRRNYIREEVTTIAELSGETIFYPTDKFPRARIIESLSKDIHNLILGKNASLPDGMYVEQVIFISKKDEERVNSVQLFDNVYKLKLIEELKTDQSIKSFVEHYGKREFLSTRYGREASGYLREYARDYGNCLHRIRTLEDGLKNFLTTAKSLGILSEQLQHTAETANKNKIAEIEREKPSFDIQQLLSKFNR